MPTPSLSDDESERRKRACEQAMREGFSPLGLSGPKGAAAGRAHEIYRAVHPNSKLSRGGLESWWSKQKTQGGNFRPDEQVYHDAMTIGATAEMPTVPNAPIVPDPIQTPTIRVRVQQDDLDDWTLVVIGDYHAAPGISNERGRWIGRHAAEVLSKAATKTALIDIGDFGSFDSLSSFEKPGSAGQKYRPTFKQDLAAIVEARQSIEDGLSGFSPTKKHATKGNHDCPVYGRPAKHEAAVAEHEEMFTYEVRRMDERFGWTWSPLGTMTFFGGVACVHAPLTGMGKEVAGEMPSNQVAMKSIHDIIYGHTHKADYHRRMKFGHNQYTIALNVGCSLPQDHHEHYIRHGQMSGWWWGINTVRISGGHIQSYDSITMAELEKRYG